MHHDRSSAARSSRPRCGIIAAVMMKRKIDGATEEEVLGRKTHSRNCRRADWQPVEKMRPRNAAPRPNHNEVHLLATALDCHRLSRRGEAADNQRALAR